MIFPFPTSSTDKTPFRDGARVLPEYLEVLMGSIDTSQYTYDEAVALVNQGMVAGLVGTSVDTVIRTHFRGKRNGDR